MSQFGQSNLVVLTDLLAGSMRQSQLGNLQKKSRGGERSLQKQSPVLVLVLLGRTAAAAAAVRLRADWC